MNLQPKIRPIWQRILLSSAMSFLACWKLSRFPTFFLPKAFRSIIKNWTLSMMWISIKSGGTRFYVDQACTFKMPATFEPKADVAPQYRLSEDEIRTFYEDGFIGPFDAFSEQEMLAMRPQLMEATTSVSPIYGFHTPRDRHLDMPVVMQLMTNPKIVERAAQILGPDVNCWRSQFFHKPAGTGQRIQWHQTSTFMVDDYIDPALEPVDRNEMFWLSIWIAFDDATIENGCMQFLPGTHDRMRTVKLGGDEGFYNVKYQLEEEIDPDKIVDMEVKRGQFIIFTERCLHGSPPNKSDKDRFAFTYLLTRPDVAVYPGKAYHRSYYNGGKFHLDRWGVVTLRGEDRLQLSRSVELQPDGTCDTSKFADRRAA